MSWSLEASKRIALRYLEAQEKVRVQRKDTGKVVWVFPDTLKEKPDQYEKVKGGDNAILAGIKRPKGWRTWDGETELKSSNIEDWVADHQVTTTKGSVLLGAAHVSDVNDESLGAKVLHQHVIPGVLKAAEKAIKGGKKVVFLAEGQSFDTEALEDEETYNEQHAVAKSLNNKFGDKVKSDTWDDDSVQLFDPGSDIWSRLTKVADGSKETAQAAMAVFNIGQGTPPDELREAGILSPEAEALVKKHFGIDVTKPLSESDIDKFYRVAFPGDFGDPPNDVSALGEVYNAARQDNLLRKIKKIEADGGVAIVTPGASHAWSLKPVLEKRDF